MNVELILLQVMWFIHAWEKLEKVGAADEMGSHEFFCVFNEWTVAGRPMDPHWLLVAANCPPDAETVSQDAPGSTKPTARDWLDG